MLIIKISANEKRLVEKANTEPELRGIRQMVMDKLAVAETMREFGKAQTEKAEKAPRNTLGWAKALSVVSEVLGAKGVTKPPFPDNTWYARINGHLRRNGATEESVRALAEYAKEHLRSPVSFDFLICQGHRIEAGEFDQKPTTEVKPIVLPSLPEE